MNDENVYNSGLSAADWETLRDILWPFIHVKDPSKIVLPEIPSHLANHPMIEYLRKYIQTGDKKYLDKAGQCLIPTSQPFGWYVPLTK